MPHNKAFHQATVEKAPSTVNLNAVGFKPHSAMDMGRKAAISAGLAYVLGKTVGNPNIDINMSTIGQRMSLPASLALSSGIGSVVSDVAGERIMGQLFHASRATVNTSEAWFNPVFGAASSLAVYSVLSPGLVFNMDQFKQAAPYILGIPAAAETGGVMVNDYVKNMFHMQ